MVYFLKSGLHFWRRAGWRLLLKETLKRIKELRLLSVESLENFIYKIHCAFRDYNTIKYSEKSILSL